MSTASLAEQLYAAYFDGQPPLPWDQLRAMDRTAWERVAEVAREQARSIAVGIRCPCGRDHMFETREQVAEQRDAALTEVERLKEELADSDNELCRLTHHKRKRGCSIPDCRNYTPRAEDDVG